MKVSWSSIWGIGGVLALLGEAVWRLLPLGLAPLREGSLTGSQAALYAVVVGFFGFAEGYRGFQQAFSPRAAARALWLTDHGSLAQKLLAPMFCMALMWATRRRLIINWLLVFGIVTVIILVREVPAPYRNMIDGGVVVGLSWGIVATIGHFARGAMGRGRLAALELS